MCNFLTLEEAWLEMTLIAMLLHRRPGLSSPGAGEKYARLCSYLVIFRFSVLLRHLDIPRNPRSVDKKDSY